MTLRAQTLHRIRFIARIVLRTIALAWLVYVPYVAYYEIVSYLHKTPSGWPQVSFLSQFGSALRAGLIGVVLLAVDRYLLNWLIPLPASGCPRCGYGVDQPPAETCPECGLGLSARASGRVPGGARGETRRADAPGPPT